MPYDTFLLFDFSTDEDSESSLVKPANLPPLFKPLFEFLEGARSVNVAQNFLRNGSGKLLVYNLLLLTGMGFPKLSTTSDSRTDWCGYPESTTVPLGNVFGEMILLLDHSKSVDRFSSPFNSTCLNVC